MSATSPAQMSLLNAVNTVLDAIGHIPVVSLEAITDVDVHRAINIIDETHREVLSRPLRCNTEDNYTLTPDGTTKFITTPNNVVSLVVDPNAYPEVNPVLRGQRLYDLKNQTYEFSKGLKARVTYLLPWDDCPQHVRWYITTQAAIKFTERSDKNMDLSRFAQRQAMEARKDFMRNEVNLADYRMFPTTLVVNIPRTLA